MKITVSYELADAIVNTLNETANTLHDLVGTPLPTKLEPVAKVKSQLEAGILVCKNNPKKEHITVELQDTALIEILKAYAHLVVGVSLPLKVFRFKLKSILG